MNAQPALLDSLYYQIPNLFLAACIYTLIGRFLLSFVFRPDSPLVIWKVFRQITDPLLRATRFVTPAVVPEPVLLPFAIIWLIVLRVAWFFAAQVQITWTNVGG